jgi:glycosyltransferase involved in cell wall biosynthesis
VRILVVTPYPPIRDGIAAYAVQQVMSLRAAGHDVEVLSPQPSAAHHHLDLRSPRGPLALARRARGYDRVILHFHPDLFAPPTASARRRARQTAGLLAVVRAAREMEVVVHEVDYAAARRATLDAALSRLLWRSVDRLRVHTVAEQERMEAAFGLPPGTVEVIDHGTDFVRHTRLDRAGARARLGLPTDGHVFVSIGFIQPHKGFDRAVAAFATLPPGAASLHVVGSVRVEEPEYLDHLEDLRDAVARTAGAHLHEGFVSDEAFDVWLVAADTVVLPYRFIWSSSVLERAALYERPVIATRVGGLGAQAPEGTILVADDDELAAAMRAVVGDASAVDAVLGPWPDPGADPAAVQAAIRDRATALRGRPLSGAPAGWPGRTAPGTRPGRPGRGRRAGARTPLDRLDPLVLPPPRSARPGVGPVKRVVRSLTAWQLDPIVEQVNALQRAILDERAAPPEPEDRPD